MQYMPQMKCLLYRLPPAFAGISASTPGALAITGRDRNEKVAIKQAAVQEQDHEKNAPAQKDARKWAPPHGLP